MAVNLAVSPLRTSAKLISVYAAVLVGHPEAAALVVAVKSVARYPEFTHDRKFAEYFLVGTLLSLLVALGISYLIRAALSAA